MAFSGPKICVAYLFALLCPSVSSADQHEACSVRVALHDSSHLGALAISAAESNASVILGYSGIRIYWAKERGDRSRISGYEQTANVTISLAAEPLPGWSKSTLGITFITPSEDLRAVVLATRVRSVAENSLGGFQRGMFPKLLGHVMAHELGHALMRSDTHCASGLMRANWNRSELLMIAHGQLRFTDQQSTVMRANVLGFGQTGATPKGSRAPSTFSP
jgi:hypothetical protein